jgi:cellulose synthase/poly-beta-1,6-N-acetylglucosamine synthase-like glycosyltransferase
MAWMSHPPGRAEGPGSPPARATSTLTRRLLTALGMPAGAIVAAVIAADRHDDGRDAADVMLSTGQLAPDIWWPALAGALGLGYRETVTLAALDQPPLPGAALDRDIRQMWIAGATAPLLAIAPQGQATARVSAFLAEHPALRGRIVIASPETLRAALRRSLANSMTNAAIGGLRLSQPHLSASRPPPPLLVGACGAALALTPFLALLLDRGAELLLLALFLPLTLLRLLAALEPLRPLPAPALADDALPRYAVLVPLYHEAAVVPELAIALAALDYPRDKLDLKLLVEADDPDTIAAARAGVSTAGWDVLIVPPSLPRTKPKALAFALQVVDADLVTVYDAEDRPAPDQLRQAAAAFAGLPEDVACLQAMLTIDRHGHLGGGWLGHALAAQFGLEYRIQFGAIVPWLAARTGFFLLGGTSNHFRRAALTGVGGWDPYNVTEDADIAVRLARAGWRLGVVASETLEEAPADRRVWTAQRCRWLKGWMQTWLVHTRQPLRLLADLGPGRFLMFHLLLGGQIISAFVFPASALAVVLVLTGIEPLLQDRSFLGDVGLMAALVTGALAWGVAAVQALQTTPARRWPATVLQVITLPLYWLLLYPAVIRAILELATAPFRWNKTPHGGARRGRRA